MGDNASSDVINLSLGSMTKSQITIILYLLASNVIALSLLTMIGRMIIGILYLPPKLDVTDMCDMLYNSLHCKD